MQFKFAVFAFVVTLSFVCAPSHADPADVIGDAIAAERMPGDRQEDGFRKPREVLSFMEVAPGQHVLDFYSGPGYYSELLSRIVGPTGSVLIHNNELYAQAAHHDLMKRLSRKRLPNVTVRKEPSNYMRLKPASLDRVLFMQVYHDLYWKPGMSPDTMGDAQKVLSTLHAALKSGGLAIVVDHIASETPADKVVEVASRLHRIDPKVVIADFKQAGFEFVGESAALRSAVDDYKLSVFNPSVRKRTDQFIYKFRRP